LPAALLRFLGGGVGKDLRHALLLRA
jgi:hypothetical protein